MTKVTAYICADGASNAIEFYKKAYGAEELYRLENPDGRLGHAEVKIGDSILMISDEAPNLGVLSPKKLAGHATSFVLDVPDADSMFQRAIDAGATVERPLKDEPYGRGGWVIDPFGHRWSIMTSNPNFKPEDMQ
ncbi:MAG TPA: VOC family protein [Dehalococcoidia bacterium]|jgi:PhnB protein